jgi:diguanylate cyclase (GGDEF)-like protein
MPKRDSLRDLTLAYAATRDILRARDAQAAQAAVLKLCHELGASVISADDDQRGALPIDLSLGEGEPLLPIADDPGLRAALTRFLIPAVSDARTVVERGLSSDRLVERATRDTLTGLWGRRSLTTAINRARPGDCVAMIDLDHFKRVNDTLGHEAGDQVLSEFGAHLRTGVRDRDIVGRLGGEEFVIVFPSTDPLEATTVLERLRHSWPAVSTQRVTFSAGVASVRESSGVDELAGQSALKRADSLMYRSKASGRDRINCDPT